MLLAISVNALQHDVNVSCTAIQTELDSIFAQNQLEEFPTKERAIELVDLSRINDCECLVDALNLLGFKHYANTHLNEAKECLSEAELIMIENKKFDKSYVDNQIFQALANILNEEYDLAIYQLERCKTIAGKIGDSLAIVNASLNQGLAYMQKADFEKSEESYLNVIENVKTPDEFEGYGYALENIAEVYRKQGKINKAWEYNNLALEYWQRNNHNKGQYFCYFHRAGLYAIGQDYEEQLEALKTSREIGQTHNIAIVDIHIAKNIGQALKNLGRQQEMASHYEKTLQEFFGITPEDQRYIAEELVDFYKSNKEPEKLELIVESVLTNSEKLRESNQTSTVKLLEINKVIDEQISKYNQLNYKNESNKKQLRWQYWISGFMFLSLALLMYIARMYYRQNQYRKTSIQKIESQNQKLNELNKVLDSKNQELENFAYVASHDLKSPLRTIISFNQLINQKLDGGDIKSAKEYFSMVEKTSKDMSHLVDDLLRFAQLSNHPLALEDIDPYQLVQEIKSDISKDITEANASIVVHSHGMIIAADRIKLRQILLNLISNGIKFKQEDKNPLITIEVTDTLEEWIFEVTDNGIGIDPKYHCEIFKMFSRLNSKTEYQGTGIGLATCAKLVRMHRGEISIQSEKGKGSTFRFTIAKDIKVSQV